MAGKGSKPRPLSVSKRIFEDNWDKVFGKKEPEEGKPQTKPMEIDDRQWYDQEYLKSLTVEQAQDLIYKTVYQVSHLFERLEEVKKINGNGHHLQQRLAKFAEDMMGTHWRPNKDEL